jgi:hypothetical protein
MAYVIMGDHNGVRRIAKAIEEVHKRIDVDSLVSLEPRHPSRLDFLRKFGGSGASMSASEVSSKICYKDGGAISETNARRIRANAGLKAVKSRSARKEH